MSVLADLGKVNSNWIDFFMTFPKAGVLSRVTRFCIFNQIDSSFVVRYTLLFSFGSCQLVLKIF